MLAEDLKKTKIVLAQAYASRDLKTLRAELHRFCGGVCYLKLPQLDYALKAFHHAAKADPLDEKALENTYLALETAMDLFWDAWKMGRF